MPDYPTDIHERQAARVEAAGKAALKALRGYVSMKCSGETYFDIPRHAGVPDGCRNDGTGCLCACHDRPPGGA